MLAQAVKWAFSEANPGLFFLFLSSSIKISAIQIEKSVDGVLGIQTHGRRIAGADDTM